MSIIANGNEIVVIGELNVDLLASGLKTGPKLGQEIIASDFEIALGSASAIFTCGITRLGRGVTFVSRVGNDDFGRFCLNELSGRGISTDLISVINGSKTGVTVVLSTPGDRAMVTYLGAIAELSANDFSFDVLNGHRHLHLTSYYLQETLQPDFASLFKAAKEKGLTTSFDPNSDPEQGRNEQVLDLFRHTDIVFLNEQEAKLIADKGDALSACEELGKYCPMIVVKLGAKGSVAYHDGEFAVVDGFTVDAVDTTGAGDSFAAGFVHSFLEGRGIHQCLTVGNACGALSAAKAGGTSGQPDLSELHDYLISAKTRSGTASV